MRIGILGSGKVGQTLGAGFIALGHRVMLGTRDPQAEKIRRWVEQQGDGASAGTFADAAAFGELLVFAILGAAAETVLQQVGPAPCAGKIVIDTTNPLAVASSGGPPTLFVGHTDSLAERIQRALPGARVVKAFNIVGYALMVHPGLPGGPPDMFIAGDDPAARAAVTDILHRFGWSVVDLGNLTSARYLEPLAMVWIISGFIGGNWRQALKMLRA